jgi:hypothetical protein
MNFKTHKKGLIALALIFFMIMPMLAAINLVHATPTGTITAVESGTGGTTNVNSWSVPSTDAIGTTVNIDVYISGASNVWGWEIPTLTWNPAVLTLETVTEGPWLETGGATFFSAPGAINAGSISGGIADAVKTNTPSSGETSAGVMVTLGFITAGYGTTTLTFGSAILYDSSTDFSANIGLTVPFTPSATVQVLAPSLSVGLFPHGQTSGIISLTSTSDPIGTNFYVDAYVSGATNNIWGWSLDVSWDPTVLEMDPTITEGSYLSGSLTAAQKTAGDATDFNPGFPNNVVGSVGAGTLQGGVSDAYNVPITSTAGAGVLCTFEFTVVGYGTGTSTGSLINISPGTSAGALLAAPQPPNYPLVGILSNGLPPTLTGTEEQWIAPAPTNPVAAITVGTPQPNPTSGGSPFGPTSDNTFTGYGITLNGATSTGGIDQEPPNTACPITTYTWSILLIGASSPITQTGSSPLFVLSDAQIGEVVGTIVATLTVTAPVPALDQDQYSPGYKATSPTTTLDIQVEQPYPGGVLDIWTQNGGNGPNVDASSFGPQQIVDLYAYVSYNGAPVVDKTVTFAISGPDVPGGTVYVTAQSDQSGLAIAQYRLPWQDSDPTSYFGEMTVSGSVDVAQVILTDTCSFYYGYQLNLNSVVITNGDTTSGTPTFNRYGMGGVDSISNDGNIVDATVSVTNTMWNSQTFWISAVIYDNNNVAVAQFLAQETIGPAAAETSATPASAWPTTNTQTYQISLTIPTWAYVGTATLYVNIFNSTSPTTLQNPIAWSPQQQAPLVITANYPNNVIPPSTSAPTQVLNLDFTVQNDEDSGYAKGYWALDNYVQTVQVWSLGSGQYEAVQTFKGTFTTYAGALSPQNGVVEPNTETGTMVGEIVSTFTATSFNPSALSVYGNLGTKNYGGTETDIKLGTYALQTGDTNAYNWLTAYFAGIPASGTGSLNNINWGFTYTITSGTSLVWSNNAALNSGDIVT